MGITAWGIGCGEEGLPGVYVNVPAHKDWIKQTVDARFPTTTTSTTTTTTTTTTTDEFSDYLVSFIRCLVSQLYLAVLVILLDGIIWKVLVVKN